LLIRSALKLNQVSNHKNKKTKWRPKEGGFISMENKRTNNTFAKFASFYLFSFIPDHFLRFLF